MLLNLINCWKLHLTVHGGFNWARNSELWWRLPQLCLIARLWLSLWILIFELDHSWTFSLAIRSNSDIDFVICLQYSQIEVGSYFQSITLPWELSNFLFIRAKMVAFDLGVWKRKHLAHTCYRDYLTSWFCKKKKRCFLESETSLIITDHQPHDIWFQSEPSLFLEKIS